MARRICDEAKLSTRARPKKIGRHEADALYQAIQRTKISAPATDCISPIGEELILKGLHKMVPGEFYAAATRPPSVYRGNPFSIEVGLAYGGSLPTQKVTRDTLDELIGQSDARTLRQFLISTFDGLGAEAADKILQEAKLRTRVSPGKLDKRRGRPAARGHAEREPLRRADDDRPALRQPRAAAVPGRRLRGDAGHHADQLAPYGLSQSRGQLPTGPVTLMVHMASVWVPFTSESKEAIAGYPEIQKELRLGLQAVGRKLGMFLNRRKRVQHEGQRRSIFLRYLGEVADAVSDINQTDARRAVRATPRSRPAEDGRGRPEARRPRPGRGGRQTRRPTTAATC